MAMRVAEIKAWLNALDDDELVGVEEGGLIIETVRRDAGQHFGAAYLEIGAADVDDDEEKDEEPRLIECGECGHRHREDDCQGPRL